MILQQLKADTNLDILAKAMKAQNGPWRSSFSLVREVSTGTPYMVRGGDSAGLAAVGTQVTLKAEPDFFVPEGTTQKRDLVCEVVKADRSEHIALSATKAVGAMLAGSFAALSGLQTMFSGGDAFRAYVIGGSILASGVMAVGWYVRSCMRSKDNDINDALINAVRADNESIRVDSVERAIGPRWSHGSAPAAIENKPLVALPPPENHETTRLVVLPPPENYDAAFLVSNLRS